MGTDELEMLHSRFVSRVAGDGHYLKYKRAVGDDEDID